MRLLYLGDVVGRSGRTALAERLPGLRRDWPRAVAALALVARAIRSVL